MTTTEMIAVEAVKFYAAKKHIGVKDVMWALEMGNDKVSRTIAELIAVALVGNNVKYWE